MIEKIKNFWATSRDILVYILTPLAFIAGYIYYLISDRNSWKNKAQDAEKQDAIQDTLDKKEEAKREADDLSARYKRMYDKFMSSRRDKSDV